MLTIKPGLQIGPFKIIEEMSATKGGMSSVYHAAAPNQQTEVALKISRLDDDNPRFNNALKQEVDILKSLYHPGVVRVLPLQLAGAKQEVYMARAVEVAGQPWYYIMEYLRGQSLHQVIEAAGVLPFPLACGIAAFLCDTLAFLHHQQIAHLDVKPENILFRCPPLPGERIEPVLIDFGVAARTKSPRPTGGSLHTMSPEQLSQTRGALPPETPLDVTKMDIYSLGVVTYRMWTGSYPFEGVTVGSITNAVMNGVVRPPSQVNPALPNEANHLMLRWLAKDPGQRPRLEELKRYLYYWANGMDRFIEIPPKKNGKSWLPWKR